MGRPGVEKKVATDSTGERRLWNMCSRCTLYSNARAALAQRLGSEIEMKLLARPESARKVARWFVQQSILQQFNTAKEIEERGAEAEGYTPFRP